MRNQDQYKGYVIVGYIRRPHGVKGELVVEATSGDPHRFKNLSVLLVLQHDGSKQEVRVALERVANGHTLLKLAGFDTRDQAESLRGVEILIPETERPQLPQGHAYYDEIIGMAVVDDETNQPLGCVLEVQDLPHGDLLAMKMNSGLERLLLNPSPEVVRIDKERGEVRVSLLPDWAKASE